MFENEENKDARAYVNRHNNEAGKNLGNKGSLQRKESACPCGEMPTVCAILLVQKRNYREYK